MEKDIAPEDWIAKLNAPGRAGFKDRVIQKTGRNRRVFLPTARMVDDYVRGLARGQRSDAATMKKQFADEHQADLTCPVTTRMHLQTVAEAALAMHARGERLDGITPFWRIMDEKDPTAKRLTCGSALIARLRAGEGL